jgi:hypothetical protein
VCEQQRLETLQRQLTAQGPAWTHIPALQYVPLPIAPRQDEGGDVWERLKPRAEFVGGEVPRVWLALAPHAKAFAEEEGVEVLLLEELTLAVADGKIDWWRLSEAVDGDAGKGRADL